MLNKEWASPSCWLVTWVLESCHHHDRDHHEEKPVDYTAYGDVDITENAFGNVTAN